MKKTAALCALFAAVLLLGGCAQKENDGVPDTPAPEKSSSAESGTQTKEAADVTVEFDPPAGWEKNEGSVLPVHYMKGTASFMVKTEPFAGATLDEVAAEAAALYQKTFDGYAGEGEAEPLTVDGKDARGLTFTCTAGGVPMKYTCVFLFAGDRTYVMTFGDLQSSFDALTPDIGAILDSIRFVVA